MVVSREQTAGRPTTLIPCCDKGAFTPDQARRILRAGADSGLLVKLHANQIESIGGIDVACELGAVSVDHLTYTSDSELAALAGAGIVATLLPGVEFSTRSPYPDARRFFDAGVEVALATDCNPGSSFTTSMQLVIALAVREMHMSLIKPCRLPPWVVLTRWLAPMLAPSILARMLTSLFFLHHQLISSRIVPVYRK